MPKLKLIKEENLPQDNEYLWRYFDIHRLLNFIQNKQVRFTRMDQFEDTLEGIPFETLIKFTQMSNEPTFSLANFILNHDKNSLPLNSKLSNRIEKILQIQSSHYVSCWFYEQRESMAMWNLYSNPDGVALKISFGKLKELLEPNSEEQNIQDYFCGKVEYQDFRNKNLYPDNGLSKLGKVSLRKDVSFSHEKEIRFVIKKKDSSDELKLGIDSEPLDLGELDIRIVCHPRMVSWKRNNIRQLLRNINLFKAYEHSEIRLRN
ncbi:Protein of unknown function [Mariniphaga anaerophila]|uniref:DUF2971 domain-containing protein n=1 Tax=Mariniphaga anaerophila TaxID=1484053 RepID=A0A1M5GG66_9BACT|nr:DUF2971 domain-containing protein [Mariniphaga anaerophila]SHG02713.1 Protein of unknown function [Mariniphaga anaerophila]